ncbi:TRAP transporter small permease [Propionivibrio dicarboxylicus]|uniref:TRAP transporter small permease protein n=1 Tax=Propionivibrio dicarboxylicus TaxID=83767 RepID=A0A1G8NTK5_9RHOO|nr:TRAP transporter small permease [Propionivibrio dicarboxylicus]SDI83515.1 TRAP-type C4-dicarboxylate transport system, small permease component [Propionivibrio dicarboxylicus]
MKQIVDGYFRLLKFLVFLCLASMVVLVFGNVVLRYVFSSGITFSEEFSRWLFVWLTFFGAIIAMRDHAHLGMDSVVSRLPVWGKKLCYVVSHLLMLLCCVMLLKGGWVQTVINMETEAAATGLPVSLFYGIILIFGVSAMAILLYDLYMMLSGQTRDDDLIQIKESEEELELDDYETTTDDTHAAGAAKKD